MAGECFERAWGQVLKEAWWTEPEKNEDLNAVVDADMRDAKKRQKQNAENPTGNKTIQRVIDRIKNDPTPKGDLPPLKRQIGGEPKPGESLVEAVQRKVRGSSPLSPFEEQQKRDAIRISNERRRRGESPPIPPKPPKVVSEAEYRKRRENLKSETLRNLFDKVKKD